MGFKLPHDCMYGHGLCDLESCNIYSRNKDCQIKCSFARIFFHLEFQVSVLWDETGLRYWWDTFEMSNNLI